jgi:RNA polymerase sigma-70 factor (ECF subfamily)
MVITAAGPESPEVLGLLTQAREGDPEAFCAMAQACETRLLRQALALCGESSTAEDLVQQTFLEAWKSLRRYDQTCRFSTWLYAILLHRHYKQLKAARCRLIASAALPGAEADGRLDALLQSPSNEASPAELLYQKERSEALRHCIEGLSEKHRRVIQLRFFEEATLSDMAVVLHCSMGTVKSRLHHALEKLRRMKVSLNLSEPGKDTRI